MKIVAIEAKTEHFPLTRPYAISYKSHAAVDNVIVCLRLDNGLCGLGAASPAPFVTGETFAMCSAALAPGSLQWLVGQDIGLLRQLCRELEPQFRTTPAARAAVDIALHDAFAQNLGLPLVKVLGRCHDSMPTSITIGIKNVAETVEEAEEYVGRGFRILKVKLGKSLPEDLERLHKLRERFSTSIKIRVDPNQGYTLAQLREFFHGVENLALEFIEQPLRVESMAELLSLSDREKDAIALDEGICTVQEAVRHTLPQRKGRIYNIKLMKCGGITEALRIAELAELLDQDLMWGCMDESVVSITAALHAAFACPRTRYLDLDGSLDLARDVAMGGFALADGVMRVLDRPGLGLIPAT